MCIMTMPARVAKIKIISKKMRRNVGIRWAGNAEDAREGRCKGCGEPGNACTYACRVLKDLTSGNYSESNLGSGLVKFSRIYYSS
jgi:hypothetical protein